MGMLVEYYRQRMGLLSFVEMKRNFRCKTFQTIEDVHNYEESLQK